MRPAHLAIGVFDGVHAGHRAVLASARATARADGGEAVALTFEPHPSRVLRPADPTLLILGKAAKEERLAEAGADRVVHQPFDEAHRSLEAAAYLPWLRAAFPGLRSVHVGENFRFGRGRAGDAASLRAAGEAAGVDVRALPPVVVRGEAASSSRVREALRAGDVALANAMLLRPYEAEGVITPGRQLGRRLGLPTLNLPWSPELVPAFGVYAAEVITSEGVAEPAVMNWGVRPTVEDGAVAPLCEAHLLRPTGRVPVPGDRIRLRWLARIREERRFAGLEELRTQVEEDKGEARRLLGLKG